MSAALQFQLRQNADELADALHSLRDWTTKTKHADEKLRASNGNHTLGAGGAGSNVDASGDEDARLLEEARAELKALPLEPPPSQQPSPAVRAPASGPTNFQSWEAYDADAEVSKLEERELERERLRLKVARLENARRQAEQRRRAAEAEAKADGLRAAGNAAFSSARYEEAVAAYTSALEATPRSATLYSNRALALLKLRAHAEAEEDAAAALALEPDNVKALLRRATARSALRAYDGALEDLERALELEPKNRAARRQLAESRQLKKSASVPRPPPHRVRITQLDDDPAHEHDPFVLAVTSRAHGESGEEERGECEQADLASAAEQVSEESSRRTAHATVPAPPPPPVAPTLPARRAGLGAPASATDVERALRSLKREPAEWAAYVGAIGADAVSVLFSRSLSPELLSPLLSAYADLARDGDAAAAVRALRCLRALSESGRFEISRMCLERKDVGAVEAVLAASADAAPHDLAEVVRARFVDSCYA